MNNGIGRYAVYQESLVVEEFGKFGESSVFKLTIGQLASIIYLKFFLPNT